MALANPEPEIRPEAVKAVRDDAIIGTGRSDYPNQVNNVLCFPFIFRGALDVCATEINEEMKKACVKALADLAMAESDEKVSQAYGGESLTFGPDYLIPKPFDPRLIVEIAPAVAQAAMDSGVATKPIEDFDKYRQKLSQFVYKSGLVMKPVFEAAQKNPKRVVYAEGEDDRVLRAIQVVIDDGLANPILIGRLDVIKRKVKELGLRIIPTVDFEVVEVARDARLHSLSDQYHRIMQRRGISPDAAYAIVRSRNSVIASLMVRRGEADAMICGTSGRYSRHLEHVLDIIGLQEGVTQASALSLLIMPKGTVFICDTNVTHNPTSEQVAEMTLLACEEIRRFGIEPKVALLSHSNFGSDDTKSAIKMRKALALLHEQAPRLEVEGEMHSDAALSEHIRSNIFPNSRLRGSANLLILPTLDAANISYNMIKMLGDGLPVGPMLIGVKKSAHILTPSATVRAIVNISALAVVDAQTFE